MAMFFNHGEIRSKNHKDRQECHQTSYPTLVRMRGLPVFELPHGGVVNDYVAFYFSPVTAFTHTIHHGNVEVVAPSGEVLGKSCAGDRAFLVVKIDDILQSGLSVCFSNYALNTVAPMPEVIDDHALLSSHVNWSLFDQEPITARIPQIGYAGVCKYFQNRAAPVSDQVRKEARMAEFLVKNAVPMDLVSCVITHNDVARAKLEKLAQANGFTGQILTSPSCFV